MSARWGRSLRRKMCRRNGNRSLRKTPLTTRRSGVRANDGKSERQAPQRGRTQLGVGSTGLGRKEEGRVFGCGFRRLCTRGDPRRGRVVVGSGLEGGRER